jgi:hypothetical protein
MPRYHFTPDERRIKACIGRMPGGAAESVSKVGRLVGTSADRQDHPITMSEVADYLEAVVEQRERFTESAVTCERELAALKADVEAVRRVFGFPSGKE